MGVDLVLQAFEDAAREPSAEVSIPPVFVEVLASPELLARLPKSEVGKFLGRRDARAYSKRAKAPPLSPASVVIEALTLLETILAEERSLDILLCEDASTGEALAQVRFDTPDGGRARTQSYDARQFAEPQLRRVPGVPDAAVLPDLVLRGVASGGKLVDGVLREYVAVEADICLRWRTAIACHPAEWAALRAFVAERPSAGFRLSTS